MRSVHENINSYYSGKIRKYGAIPAGVDWNSENGQFVRFEQLSKIIRGDGFSINDVGCGYGKYIEYLSGNFDTLASHYMWNESLIDGKFFLFNQDIIKDKNNVLIVFLTKNTDFKIVKNMIPYELETLGINTFNNKHYQYSMIVTRPIER